MSLQGKTAFVSGSGRNIGRAIALLLADAGCNVVLNGSSDSEACEGVAGEVRERGAEALVAMADVSDSGAVQKLGEQALAQFGCVDIVINNASIRPSMPFLEMTEEHWHKVIGVDMHSAFYTSKAFLPGMIEKGWGRIINITGMNAMHGYSGRCPVSVSKHGLWGMTKSMAKEFGPKGVTVNAISPGPIGGDYADASMAKHIEEQVSRIPLGHIGKPDDIAGLCVFLISDAGSFVSGQMIASNGAAET